MKNINRERRLAIDEKVFLLKLSNIYSYEGKNIPFVFLSLFCVSLSRIIKSEDMVIGYQVQPHEIKRADKILIPMAIRLEKTLRVTEFVNEAIENIVSSGLKDSNFSHAKVLTDVRDGDRQQLFDLEFTYSESLKVKKSKKEKINSLNIDINRNAKLNGYEISISFNQEKFRPNQIEKIYDVWLSLLNIVQNNLNTQIKDLCLISLEEKNLVMKDFNKTRFEFPKDKCLPDLFWEQIQRQPDNIAVACDSGFLTYKELSKSSLDLAIYLQSLGAVPDDCIGLFFDPSVELMISVWGVLISGSAYLPLSPEYPEERLKYMIEDSATKIIVVQEELKEKLSELVQPDIQIISLNDVKKFKELYLKGDHFKLRANSLKSNNIAYIIYTSGSTGRPKGVMIEHHSIVNQMHWLKEKFNLNNQSTILQKTPLSFDAAQWEILAISCGSKVIMANPGSYRNPAQLIATIIEYDVTILQCVPTLLQALLDTNEFQNCKSLVQIFSGGEALSKHLALECIKVLPHCTLVNLYGPTECTINTSAYVINPSIIENHPSSVSIGSPINNTYYYILDHYQTPVAVGEIGELYIGGEGLSRGYLHQAGLTAEKFVDNPFEENNQQTKLYKTGDLAFWNADGTVHYVGRSDNQIKLRGFRIELDEIKSAIETHDWVKNAAVIIKNDPYNGSQNLIAFIELNPKEAALMDQGNHDAHHQSKESKAQVIMQLSNTGCREEPTLKENYRIDLPGKTPTEKQERTVFARKTYRFFEGDIVRKKDILQFLQNEKNIISFRKVEDISYANFGEILRYFGQYLSEERLLPKYGYASPGALYATQMYLELDKVGNLRSGYYYYHPVHHQLIFIKDKIGLAETSIKIHFIGKKSAIEPIYKNNIQEVLEIETGHMVGLFEKILPKYGLAIEDSDYVASVKEHLEVNGEDFYLGTFEIVAGQEQKMEELVDVYVQGHSGKITDLKAGLYHYQQGDLKKISDKIIHRKHVIAINQEVYNRALFGITIISKTKKDWMSYINLGRKLQKLQMNNINIGLMSSGYSSKTGNDLPSAKRICEILEQDIGPSYFAIGGRISTEQLQSRGMKEDSVHMKGPAEMIKDDLINFLPDYMIPNKVIVLDKMPLTVNGKIDFKKLKDSEVEFAPREYIAPRNEIEFKLSKIWKNEMKREDISVKDNFFELGGNSIMAVSIVNKISKELNFSLSLQVLFEVPTIEKLALKISHRDFGGFSRLIPLQSEGVKKPIFCWPGLGGYCMNLRLLAERMGVNQSFYGIQAYGINKNEIPYATLEEMAAEDVKLIRKVQPAGPYTLWGYSFGSRVAFEVAYQLEQAGEIVENLFLIAPGSPKIDSESKNNQDDRACYNNKVYLSVLFSVFMGSITGNALNECLQVVNDETSFLKFIINSNPNLDLELARRIVNIVSKTYELKYSLEDLKKRKLKANITIFKAQGDDYSFIEKMSEFQSNTYTTIILKADHYNVLKSTGVEELITVVRQENLDQLEAFKSLYNLPDCTVSARNENLHESASFFSALPSDKDQENVK